jgi:hypothetical protein
MTDRLDQLKQLCEKATPGPWLYRPNKYDDWGIIKTADVSADGRDVGYIVARAYYGGCITQEIENQARVDKSCPYAHNGLLITASRTALPELIALCEQMAGALEKGVELLEPFQDTGMLGERALNQHREALSAYKAFQKGQNDDQ